MAKAGTKAVPGRPAFKATTAQRNAVAVGAGAGMPHSEIALALGVSRSTLIRHFKLELSSGAAAKRIQVLCALYTAAKRGSASAAKCYLALGTAPAAPREPAPGKKVLAQRAAVTAAIGSDWESLLPDLDDAGSKGKLQ